MDTLRILLWRTVTTISWKFWRKPGRISALQLAWGLSYGHDLQMTKKYFRPLNCNKNINDVKVKGPLWTQQMEN